MQKRSLWILLVIVLVCLNWFKDLVAQDLTALSEVDKVGLLTKLSKPAARGEIDSYRTPPIYDSTWNLGLPHYGPDSVEFGVDSLLAGGRAEDTLMSFEELSPFGLELFAGPREVSPPNDIASASDYILGPGDNLIISLWGQVEKEYQLTVDREGKVFIPKLGELVIWGRTLGSFKPYLKERLSTIYSGFELSVSLGKIRSIRVYMTGEVRRPGAYTVSSLTSLFNALYLAGGPNENGSMRQIRLMRNGRAVGEVDLYKFLLEGDNSSDVRLESGDAVFVPVAGTRVAIRGKIRREAVYELREGQTALDLMALAGNPTADAYLDRVMLERVSGWDDWEVLDLKLNPTRPDSVDDIELLDGDRLTVFSVFEMKRNIVAVFGHVKHPGHYERNDSARVSDLIGRAGLQPYDVYYERANLFRRHTDWRTEVTGLDLDEALNGSSEHDILLQDGDSLHIYSIADVFRDKYVYIEGEVNRPGRYPLYDNMTIEDLIFLAGSFKRGASMLRAEVARFDSLGEVTLYHVGFGNDEARLSELQEDDRVYIRQIPQWQLHRTVIIQGEVLYPGEYVLSGREETLYDLIHRAGGITELAFPRGTVFERRSIGQNLERLQVPDLLEKSSPVVQDSLGNISRMVLFEYEPQSMDRIVLDVEHLLASNGSASDIVLEPGDRIFIPSRPSGISVLGAVGANGTIKFEENESVRYYVHRAGNFTSQADKGGLRLIKANGEVFSGKGIIRKRVDMGDIVVVPTKIHREKNWMKTLATALTTTTGVLASIVLIDKL